MLSSLNKDVIIIIIIIIIISVSIGKIGKVSTIYPVKKLVYGKSIFQMCRTNTR